MDKDTPLSNTPSIWKGSPLEPEQIIMPAAQWVDGACEVFDAGAALERMNDNGGCVVLTVGRWREGKGDDPARKPSDFIGTTFCYLTPHDARVAAMAAHDLGDQLFRAASELGTRQARYAAEQRRFHEAIMAAGKGAG